MIRDQLLYALSRLSAFARQRDWQNGETAGLTPTQGEILRLLSTRREGLRLKEVAAQLSVRSATASDAVSSLVAKSLVNRFPDPEHGRAVRISLTHTGRAMLGEMPDSYGPIVDLLSTDDANALFRIVTRTIAQLQRAGQIAPQRMCISCRYFVSETNPDRPDEHFCNMIGAPLKAADLRIDCPEHEEASTPS